MGGVFLFYRDQYMSITAEAYIDDVLSGRILAGQYIIKAFQRHRQDLGSQLISSKYWFDPEAGDRPIEFCETFCIPPDSEEPMRLMPWQHAIIFITYGWKRKDGFRRFNRVYIEIAKKNGKTGLVAALSLYHLIADGEPSPRVFFSATTGKQADIGFRAAAAMRMRHPDLKKYIHQTGNEPITALYTANLGRLSKMARDGATEDGALVSCAILDELHRWKRDSNLMSVLKYGGRTLKQPILIQITTAGASADGTSLCWSEREAGTRLLDGMQTEDEFAPWIFSMDPGDDWKDPANWVKSNPSLDYIIDHDHMKKEFAETEGKPSARGDFKRFCLNIWTNQSADPAIDIDQWKLCCRGDLSNYPDPKILRKESLEELKGRLCFMGLDLAPKLDTSALVALFPPLTADEKWRIIEWFWCPEESIAERSHRDKVPYDMWAESGFIVPTPGNLTDVRYIAEQITELTKIFDVKEIAYDASWSQELIRMLQESGFDMPKFVDFPQSPIRMNGPCIELVRKILRLEFAHDLNPVMFSQMRNLRWNTNKTTGFVKPSRDRKGEKIDGCASLIMALARATDPDNVVTPPFEFWAVSS